MDPEEERVMYLSRVGHEKIFKYGTYTMVKEKPITQDHPFYAARDEDDSGTQDMDAAQLAQEVLSSNFKVGLTQEEVDALLNGI